ncbi:MULTISPECIES: hypothetical protein [Thalassospira]|uniref:hypothetical protein n=1 Tax=Thalassospira TaxID=168934 RepID=UPI0008DE77CE|nr:MULTISPECIES: hypothetical protein [Thalassospira]MAB35503.1 AbrB/MazE/SpoVT family DNA-binding domain-containing protein [Thalassospira sp.]OHZ00479.1 hypothetical protein BC440_20635 [Thalassospira sp. MIT1004]HBS21614.1 AbrB/MazE/SpoVT family DNA-binding domain-containing protein [Thalassospira sp.]|tara:strand:+ start:227 stop:424 length:198 start_codon:yes stop_codon:yes gene_type:complete
MPPKPPKSISLRGKTEAADTSRDLTPTDQLWDNFFDTQSVSDDFMSDRNQPDIEKTAGFRSSFEK